jgi:mannose-6-phosphate isomerase-like protein (cupin superfamily)
MVLDEPTPVIPGALASRSGTRLRPSFRARSPKQFLPLLSELSLFRKPERQAPTPAPEPIVRRPWGSFRSVDVGHHHQVKRIVVEPGRRLSLQRHRQRAEHWVVVQGTASIVRGEESRLLRENESVFIPEGCVHRLENPGSTPLHLVEVQVGDYLGEDDIERLADDYGRTC